MVKLFAVLFFLAWTAATMLSDTAKADGVLDDYLSSAVASERCGGNKLTLIQEIRLAQRIKHEFGDSVTSIHIRDGMATARAAPPIDCGSASVVEQVRVFLSTVRPLLDSPYLAPAQATSQ